MTILRGQFRDEVKPARGRLEHRERPLLQPIRIEVFPFCLQGHCSIESYQDFEILGTCLANDKLVERGHGASCHSNEACPEPICSLERLNHRVRGRYMPAENSIFIASSGGRLIGHTLLTGIKAR